MLAFDTHYSFKKLTQAGFDEAQAEAQIEVLRAAIEQNVATKADLENRHQETKTDLERLIIRIDDLESRVDALERKVDVLSQRVEDLSQQITDMQREIETLRVGMIALERKFDDLLRQVNDRFKQLDERFRQVDERFDRIENNMATKKDVEAAVERMGRIFAMWMVGLFFATLGVAVTGFFALYQILRP